MKTKIIKNKYFNLISLFFLVILISLFGYVSASTCPDTTQVRTDSATLVGEITDDGGDPNLYVWFQYGKASSSDYSETSRMPFYGTGLFCQDIYNLDPCTQYRYRAVAQNRAGTTYGEYKTFTTQCLPVSVDLKISESVVQYGDTVVLSWSSQNASYCQASGDWSGTKPVSGSETYTTTSTGTLNFVLTCYDQDGTDSDTDSVQLTVNPKLPTVITKPAIVTY